MVQCPICDSRRVATIPARIAPFIAARSGLLSEDDARTTILPAEGHLCCCCQHMFFTPFLSEDQLSRIYIGYRNSEYNASRISFEPGYADMALALSNPSSKIEADREAFYEEMFPHWRDRSGTAVDFGGADGHFSKLLIPKAEITIVDEGFERGGGDFAGLIGTADYIIAQHAFEHISQPKALLSRIAGLMKSGAEVFIELPKEYKGSTRSHFSNIEAELSAGSQLPWDSFTTLHEHIQHFSVFSMRRLILEAGLEIVETCQARMDELTILAIVGRKL